MNVVSTGKALEGKVAVVAGATRGAGRGIARALGEAGATVYCTGRSVSGQPSPYGRPETIEETAELVTRLGGRAIPVRVDHTVEAEVRALFERVVEEQGRLDVVVDSVAGEDPVLGAWTDFWKTDLTKADTAIRQALLSHVITAKHAAPPMIAKRRGLIVQVTEGDLPGGAGGNVLADIAKAGIKNLACRLAEELHKHHVTSIAITPGFLRSESMLDHFGVTEANWQEGGEKDEHFLHSESPLFVGRAVAALAQDKEMFTRTGDLTSSWELARHYGFTDEDGRRPDWGTHFIELLPTHFILPGVKRQSAWLDRMAGRAREYLGKG